MNGWHDQSIKISLPLDQVVHLYYLEFAPWLSLVSHVLDWLSPEEQQRAARLRFADGRDRFILSHAYLRSVLARYLMIHPKDVQFAVSSMGKPWLIHGNPVDFGFNLSHCKTYVAVAVAPTLLVGIDVEERRPQVDALGIAKRYFTPQEAEMLSKLPSEEIDSYFLKIWTCKEAFVKAIGLGLSYSLNRFYIDGWQDGGLKFGGIESEYGLSKAWSLRTHMPSPDCHIAIAVKLPNAVVTSFC